MRLLTVWCLATWCFAPGTDPADRDAMIRLHDVASFDRGLDMVTRPWDAEAIHAFERALSGGRSQVQLTALILLTSAVPQEALPAGKPSAGVTRAVSTIAEATDASAAAESLRLYARRVLWHVQVQSLDKPEVRAGFLAPLLEQRSPDALYYAYAAVDYLAELGGDGARVLQAFVDESEKRSLSPDVLERARLGLRKIALSRQVERAGPADAVRILVAAAHTPTKRRMDAEFGTWVVEQLARRRPEADTDLRALTVDEQVTENVRNSAEFALTDGANRVRWRW